MAVGGALGYGDARLCLWTQCWKNVARIVRAVNLPVTLDFEGGYAVDGAALADNFSRALGTGIVGCNFEDQVIGGAGLHTTAVQAARIAALRGAAERAGIDAFINARTDVFLKAPPTEHGDALLDEALARGRAYAQAGASGLFLPGLRDAALIERACAESALPVNIMVMPNVPPLAQLKTLGVQRVSYGPGPGQLAMKAIEDAAKIALA